MVPPMPTRAPAKARWIAAILAVAWILTLAPELPEPIGPWAPIERTGWRWPNIAVESAIVVGTMGGMVGWLVVTGGWRDPAVRTPDRMSNAQFTTMTEASGGGVIVALLLLTMGPPWLCWLAARLATRGGFTLCDPAFLVAASVTLLLAIPMTGALLADRLRPVPTWLLLPPAGTRDAALDDWCGRALYPRRAICETAKMRAPDWGDVDGYTFPGARCVAADVAQRFTPRERTIDTAAAALGIAVDAEAVVQRDVAIGDATVAIAVRPSRDAMPVLAVDVTDDPSALQPRAAELARLGVPDYWVIDVDPQAERPVMLFRRSSPDPTTGEYLRVHETTADDDVALDAVRLGDMRLSSAALLPARCDAPVAPEEPPMPVFGPDAIVPTPPRCQGDDPDMLARCTLEHVAAGQAVFRAAHGRYFTGRCDELPEVTLPKGVSCSQAGSDFSYSATAAHPESPLHQVCSVAVDAPDEMPIVHCAPAELAG